MQKLLDLMTGLRKIRENIPRRETVAHVFKERREFVSGRRRMAVRAMIRGDAVLTLELPPHRCPACASRSMRARTLSGRATPSPSSSRQPVMRSLLWKLTSRSAYAGRAPRSRMHLGSRSCMRLRSRRSCSISLTRLRSCSSRRASCSGRLRG